MSARSEILEGVDPEERAWLGSYLDVFAKRYAHELAQVQRAERDRQYGPLEFRAERIAINRVVDLIDPEVP